MGSEALVWFTSYLSGRSHRVCCNQEAAQWKPVSRGVPQGSCLSPLLFNIFVRNIPTIAETECVQYADDITESAADKDIEVVAEKLTSSFNSVKQFCASKQLVVNTSKTQLIILKTPTRKIPQDFKLVLDKVLRN